ncbi:hypothetical protein ONS95_011758 [Cadophora gregata]|uniref:uncharacterized protein n=1 Tax=Cadophora gregata TaxID=51156 RepID=UPI0026DAC3B8|nr:uncharacterized protein ONS95_011758 [Cadophora gregata]KAK0120355.1 hypothetical protein ONS95_011758 [Cadophora gregata]
MTMAAFSTLEALQALCKSIPEWNTRLDELNSQIALRQIELARLTEDERPPTRSLKNQGSTESLRPKDSNENKNENENPFALKEPESTKDGQTNSFDTPKSNQNSSTRPSSAAAQAATTSLPRLNSNARPSPGPLTRRSSQQHPAQGRTSPAVLRKRKTESLASGESVAPKYKTRSMIIVYYDSAVQTAFEDLVKFVSGSRNSMRKGKMAAKMAEMKRAAELEIGDEDMDNKQDNADDNLNNSSATSGTLLVAQTSISPGEKGAGPTATLGPGLEPDALLEPMLPKLNFVSTRQMGPSRGRAEADKFGGRLSVSMLRGYRRGGGETLDIFDDLDKGLEWCQAQCEHAAHQFLREGDCSTEIVNIKQRLEEVKATSEKEIKKLKRHEEERSQAIPIPADPTKSLQMKAPNVRKEMPASTSLEVDDSMEVDDEGVVDLELPSKLIFKRSRDI